MNEAQVAAARRFMQAYADGDSTGLLAILADDWRLHERDGSVTSRRVLADITDSHRDAFPEKELVFLHELAQSDHVAHHVRFTLVHSGRYHDLEPTGRRVELSEMIFHRMTGARIAESWRMTYPDGVYDLLTEGK